MPPPSRWRRLAVAGVAAAAAAYVAYQWWYGDEESPVAADDDDDDDDDTTAPTPTLLPPDLAERSLTSWAGAAEAEAAARRRARAEEEAEEARMRAGGGGGATARPAARPVEVEMEAVRGREGDAGSEPAPAPPPPPPPDPAADALFADAAADLDRHWASVQEICDGVTLPSAARDLGAALAAVADVDGLTRKLRKGSSSGGGGSSGGGSDPLPSSSSDDLTPAAKLAAWCDLRDAAFTAAVGGPWLVAGLALALRVQLNVLGRHLFLAAHVEGGGGNGMSGGSGAPSPPAPPKVSTAAQARLLEFGHYFVQAGAADLLARGVRPAVLTAVTAGTAGDLGAPVAPDALLDRLSAAHAAVDRAVAGWVSGEAGATTGWPALLLPPPPEAEAALAAGELAATSAAATGAHSDPSALAALAADAALVRGMAAELATIYASPRFAAAARAAAAAVAGQAAAALAAAVEASGGGGADPPLAKAVPRAAAVGRALLDPGTEAFAAAVRVVGGLAEVRGLCAAVYSCGPPL